MMKKSNRDALYADLKNSISDFVFDEHVASVFEDMIERSVPGYADVIGMIGVLAGKYVQPRSSCYDLGCSLGAGTLAMRAQITDPTVKIMAVDNSQAMAEKCRENIARQSSQIPAEVLCADIREVEIQKASMVVLNFTLQFVEPGERLSLLKRITQGLLPGGILVLSEKIAFEDKKTENFQTALHHHYKKLRGYSDLEISQKRTALEKVLIPETLKQHQQRLQDAGFKESFLWFQCFNFISLVAFK